MVTFSAYDRLRINMGHYFHRFLSLMLVFSVSACVLCRCRCYPSSALVVDLCFSFHLLPLPGRTFIHQELSACCIHLGVRVLDLTVALVGVTPSLRWMDFIN